jgi:pimeloyl-ACP methyl ester carboxylesterase
MYLMNVALHEHLASMQSACTQLFQAQTKVAEVYRSRCQAAFAHYTDALAAGQKVWWEQASRPQSAPEAWMDVSAYSLDFMQRSILFWDTLRQRGNNWIEHEKANKPPLLDFHWEMVADARKFPSPANYALVRIVPPENLIVDPGSRPFMIIDPRAGHGPGIGGFKQDSQVGVAMRAGHPVYVVIFFPEPEPNQTLADVAHAEADFLRIVHELHPEAPKPVVVGNCQGGWAAMMLGALDPDHIGSIVINGAPMSYWAGNDGENPMRYAGGMLGGTWPALLASDLGGGQFDGAYLVENFEYLNPGNTYFNKYYNLFSKIDSEPPRFLEFERWWGGFFMMNRNEIKWIVENLFVGNKLSTGNAAWAEGETVNLANIRSPIVLFASLGDNITPPQQAINWVLDLYPSTEALKANGQVIVGLVHESVGHLGIFVSGAVAKREHTQIVDLADYIEQLPPGLYSMQLEERHENGAAKYDVVLTERRIEDLQAAQKYGRKDEIPFHAVAETSNLLAASYERLVHPVLAATITPAMAKFGRHFHPQRIQRWIFSDINPCLRPLAGLAQLTRTSRTVGDAKGFSAATEQLAAASTSAWWNLYRDLRDAKTEATFFGMYLTPSVLRASRHENDTDDSIADPRNSPSVRAALNHIAQGNRAGGLVRIALLLIASGSGQRRLSAIKQARELVGDEAGLLRMPANEARAIIREQSYAVDYEPAQALQALPMLLAASEDRRMALDLLSRLEERLTATDGQVAMLGKIRAVLGHDEDVARASALQH